MTAALTLRDAKTRPPTYPMQAHPMRVDLFQPLGDNEQEQTPSGLKRLAPWQPGAWILQPRYGGALPCIYDVQTSTFWSRCLHAMTFAMPDSIRVALGCMKLPDEFRWIHGLMLNRIDERNATKIAFVTVDLIHPKLLYHERREILNKMGPPELGIRTLPANGSVWLVPEFTESSGPNLWAGLHLMNQQWDKEFYSGIEAKSLNSKYYFQLDDHKKLGALAWQAHPFDEPL